MLGWKIGLLIAIIAIFKLPIERKFEHVQAGTRKLDVELRSKLTQNLAVALLSGFRATVADFIWLKAHDAWMDEVWYKLKEGIQLAVVLQPHAISFWDTGSWHMAYNASHSESENPKYPTDAYRRKAQLAWIDDGKTFLEEGILNNPDSYLLHFRLGWLISDRFKLDDPLGAVPHMLKASSYPDAPLYVYRMVGRLYERAASRAKTKEEELYYTEKAYEVWKKIWITGQTDNLVPRIAKWGREAEVKLAIKPEKRIFPSDEKPSRLKP
jgi:hypothetical protein